MDPNETLRRLREYNAAALAGDDDVDSGEAAELFESLDGWLSSGGFLPDAWQREA